MAENKSWLGRFLSKHFGSKGADEDQKVTAEQSFFVNSEGIDNGIQTLMRHLNGNKFSVSDVNPRADNDSISLYDKVNVVIDSANAMIRDIQELETEISGQSAQIIQKKVKQFTTELKDVLQALPKYCEVAHAKVLMDKSAGVQFEGNIREDINFFKTYAKSEIQRVMDDLHIQSSKLQYAGNDLDKPAGGSGISPQL